jgi:hypothetical protein
MRTPQRTSSYNVRGASIINSSDKKNDDAGQRLRSGNSSRGVIQQAVTK